MKKSILLLTLAAICWGTVFAQDTPALKPPDTSSVTVTKFYNDVKGAVEGLATNLKVGSSHVYAIVVRQQVIDAWMWLAVLGVSLLFASVAVFMYKKGNFNTDNYGAWDMAAYTCLVSSILHGATFIAVLLDINVIITGFTNPEYGAMREIAKLIHP